MGKITENGTYTFTENKLVLKDDSGLIIENCQLVNEEGLHCNTYALLYEKIE